MLRIPINILLTVTIVVVHCVNICVAEVNSSAIRDAGYALAVTPHDAVGTFRLEHDPDRPVLAYYGGIGLQLDENGEWTDYGIDSKEGVDRLIKRCVQNGMSRICANIMFQWTPSKLLGPIPNTPVPDDAETLYGYAIEQAHKHNIEVYIDIPVFGRRTRDAAFAEANPDIYTKSFTGEIREEFFSPAHPKVRAFRIAVLLEALSQYPADGILLDFIRWPSYELDLMGSSCDWGYEDVMLERFRESYDLPADFVPTPDDPRFIQARADCVTQFIQELRDVLAENGIDLPIGVYNSNLYGRGPSLRQVCQDWAGWERLGLVDQHHPMFYMDSPARLTYGLRTLIDVCRPEAVVFGPIFLDGPGPFTDERVVDAARRMIKAGADGIWFCREMEVEALGLWPTVKRVSELSISAIRAEAFDPYEENLAVNGAFDAGLEYWAVSPGQRASVTVEPSAEKSSVMVVDLDQASEAEVSQTIEHYASPVVALRSIGIACSYRIDQAAVETDLQLVIDLQYTDGLIESHAFILSGGTQSKIGWLPFARDLVVKYGDNRFLESTTVRIVFPRGDGSIYIDKVALTPDPLHNPVDLNPKDEQ